MGVWGIPGYTQASKLLPRRLGLEFPVWKAASLRCSAIRDRRSAAIPRFDAATVLADQNIPSDLRKHFGLPERSRPPTPDPTLADREGAGYWEAVGRWEALTRREREVYRGRASEADAIAKFERSKATWAAQSAAAAQ